MTDQKVSSINTALIKGRMSTSRIMFELWERNCDNLTQVQLEWFSRASEHASILTQDM